MSTTLGKRRREQAKQERRQAKEARRAQRQLEKAVLPRSSDHEDPDLAGMLPGPQRPRDQDVR